MTQILAAVAYFVLVLGNSLVILIYGWGLTPKNWWVIIIFGVVTNVVLTKIGDHIIREMRE